MENREQKLGYDLPRIDQTAALDGAPTRAIPAQQGQQDLEQPQPARQRPEANVQQQRPEANVQEGPSQQRPAPRKRAPQQRPRQQQRPSQQRPQQQARPSTPAPISAAPSGGFVSATEIATRQAKKSTINAYDQYSRMSVDYVGKKRMSTGRKVGVAIFVIALIAALAAAGAYAYSQMRKAEINADLHDMEEEELEAIDNELTGHVAFDQPFTMLLLGSDERLDDPDMGARTDTIILVRVDPTNKAVSMVSVPRDTMVQLPGVGPAKINAAYYYGGAAGTIAAVKDLCGVDIDHYAAVNFDGLVQLVDAIGGIDVFVDERIDDWKAGNAIVEAGQQHLNGEQALVLARSRDYADGDYTRQANQRKVIMGIVERAMNAPATELAGLIQASTGFIQTDSGIDFDWIYSLADQIRHTDTENPLVVNSTTLPSAPAYVGDVSYVIADTAGVAELMKVFLSGGDVSQPIAQSSIGTDIANVGGSSGPVGGVVDEDYYYYEEPAYYEEPVYEPVQEEYYEPVDDGGGEAPIDEGGDIGGGEGGEGGEG